MKNNTLESLNNFLFGQLERLDNPEISASELKREIERSKAMTQVATQIINGAEVMLSAQRFVSETAGRSAVKMPRILGGGEP